MYSIVFVYLTGTPGTTKDDDLFIHVSGALMSEKIPGRSWVSRSDTGALESYLSSMSHA